MSNKALKSVKTAALAFGISYEKHFILKSGGIHKTYLVLDKCGDRYILQCINQYAFSSPKTVIDNIMLLSEYHKRYYTTDFLSVMLTPAGIPYYEDGNEFWRCLEYIADTYSADKHTPLTELYEVGFQIGLFHREFLEFPVTSLAITIPNFHNIRHRFELYENKLGNFTSDDPDYNKLSENLLTLKGKLYSICKAIDLDNLPVRVVHNDTSLGNVLLDQNTGKCRCMIDMDTVMPGLIIYDFGDSSRDIFQTYSDLPEDERLWAFECFCRGYADCTKNVITTTEIRNLYNGIWLITLELGIRFVNDYTENNSYFSVQYEKQNLDRASAQFSVLTFLEKYKKRILEIIDCSFGII